MLVILFFVLLMFGAKKLLYLGSSCIYPREAPQPMREEHLLTGPLEATNEWYAIAKIAGIKLCQAYRKQYGCDFISAMPTNLYGPNDNFDLASSHVLPAMIRKFVEAHESGAERVVLWGDGSPTREFLYVEDAARGICMAAEAYSGAEVRHGPVALLGGGFPALILAQDDATRHGLQSLGAELAARNVEVLLAGGRAAGVTELPTVTCQAALAPLLLVGSVYRLLAQLAVARGQDPDRPPHLRKVTGTL
jgi:hypothetical protein